MTLTSTPPETEAPDLDGATPASRATRASEWLSPAGLGGGISRGLRGLFGHRAAALDRVAVVVSILLVVIAVIGPFIAPYDPYLANPADALLPPSAAHWMGTDDAGRDVLSRLLVGAATTLLAAVAVVLISTVVGVLIACAAVLSPRGVDATIMRICDIFMALPAMVLALGIAAALGPSLGSVVLAMVIAMWPGTTRLVRGILRVTMNAAYVESARVNGISRFWTLVRHVLPNSLDSVYVQASMEISGAVVLMAGLAYLGVGAPPPSADWGAMVAQGREYITTAWWVATFPGLAITVAAIAFGLLGDAIRVRLDPSLRRKR
ncbi:peptide/nickel transport system permease protein [Microbacterium sp. BE35]|uniref:ABC transporter permease n=1 Tax=Microbacterium sp. BE35 TaxID=2817773 RepID=UPI00285F37AE|nr:ABC transporter permease [Microbacterium sp. BE35]MDR7191081.1 peptide/nickel transport system permease protein [Microbacterium sp. BE35]